MNKIGRLLITGELIVAGLHLPDGTEIIGCRMDPERHQVVEFQVRHHSLKDVESGQLIPQIIATFTEHIDAVSRTVTSEYIDARGRIVGERNA